MRYKFVTLLLLMLLAACKQTDEKSSNVVVSAEGIHKDSVSPMSEADIKILKDSMVFDQLAVRFLLPLADSTGGKMYFSVNALETVATIAKIIKNHATDSADIVLLIDKTGSMEDDIAEVKKSLTAITNEVSRFQNIQMAVATYGDRWSEPDDWFDMIDLTNDYSKIKKRINRIEITGGGDAEESVYDGLFEVLKRIKWRSATKRMILVVGDAPPLIGNLTKHTQEDIFKQCQKLGIKANLYPIIVGFGGISGSTLDTNTYKIIAF